MKKHNRIDLQQGLQVNTVNASHKPTIPCTDSRWDWAETDAGVGSLKVRFSVNQLTGSPDSADWQTVIIGSLDAPNLSTYESGWMLYYTKDTSELFFYWGVGYTTADRWGRTSLVLQENTVYDVVVVKVGMTIRMYVQTVSKTVSNTSRGSTVTALRKPITIGGKVVSGGYYTSAISTVYEVVNLPGTELDRWNGTADTTDIDAMYTNGNYVPERRHPYVAAHYTLQDIPEGGKMMDCVEQYNYAKGTPLQAVPLQLLGYASGDILANGSAIKDIVTKTTAVTVDGSGNEVATGLPVLSNALKVSGAGEYVSKAVILSNTGKVIVWLCFNLDKTISEINSGYRILLSFSDAAGAGTSIDINTANFLYVNGLPLLDNALVPGFNYFYLEIENGKGNTTSDARITVRGNQRTGATSSPNISFSAFTEVRFFQHYFYNVSIPANLISVGVGQEELSHREVLQLWANSRVANPKPNVVKKFKAFVTGSSPINSSSNLITNFGSDAGSAGLVSFSANQLNPAHADYAIKSLASLRGLI